MGWVATGNILITRDGGVPGAAYTSDAVGQFQAKVDSFDTAPAPAESYLAEIDASIQESSAAPTESMTMVAKVDMTDSVTAPAEQLSYSVKVGATTATATNTEGAGWTNPTNAQGINDGAVASMNSAAGINPTQQSGELLLVFAAIPNAPALSTSVLTVYGGLVIGLLGTGSKLIQYSSDGGNLYGNSTSVAITDPGPWAIDITPLALSNLGNVRVRITTSVRGGTVESSSATVDAAVLNFT